MTPIRILNRQSQCLRTLQNFSTTVLATQTWKTGKLAAVRRLSTPFVAESSKKTRLNFAREQPSSCLNNQWPKLFAAIIAGLVICAMPTFTSESKSSPSGAHSLQEFILSWKGFDFLHRLGG